MNNIGTSIIIAAALGASAYFFTHIYSVVPTQTGVYTYVVNQVTGSVKICSVPGCSILGTSD